MVFEGGKLYDVQIERREGEDILYINFLGAGFVPSISDSGEVMGRVVDALIENPGVSRIVFVQQKNYNYPFSQISLLAEVARVYNYLLKQENILSPERLELGGIGDISSVHGELTYLVNLLRQDPVACYLELNAKLSFYGQRIRTGEEVYVESLKAYVRLLDRIKSLVGKLGIIDRLKGIIESYTPGDRSVYDDIFRADIMPNFTFTRLVAQLPENAELIDQYKIKGEYEDITVTVLEREEDSKFLYHIMPSEYILSEEHHMLLNLARNVLIQHEPKAEEFTDPERTRTLFFNVARDLVSELAQSKGINLNFRELNRLATILVRQTVGLGLIEVLLMDDKLQDVYLNSPIAQNPVFVRHQEWGECSTNVIPSFEDADSWAAKLRLQSGRPLDEANPILDSDLNIGNLRARVSAIQKPLSPSGLAYAIRRHRDRPWTLPLFINNKMINSFSAGLLSFLIDGSRTLLIAGTRSSGKTSLLGSLMLEIMPRVRTLVLEDTLELPVSALRKIGYNIQSMKVRSALLETSNEIEASEGIRASLRFGDSAMIVGEVRSEEAKALYEAMRVGALANVVAGTIHGASPYGVFDRLVNDLKVPVTSFKATDLVLVANPIKTSDGLHSMKRVVQLTEVRKHWTHDPEEENGFVDLLRYDVEKDELEPTEELINGESEVIKSIAGNVKGWAGNWDAVYDNIILRGKIKQEVVDIARKLGKPEILEAKFNSMSNDVFHRISEEVREEVGLPDSERVFPKWKEWLLKKAKDF
ncbi:secretion system protein [Candidatus Pacearchaeota archaeon CG_4_9_14_0_2_um_filter_39_13]|nr:type II/IV secretion system ATPase subunit [Candidatus Pacearchaeota archaeon]PJC44544.1 MAG: secretion system protein [Candidatus Pacearchaeota archaeon CG_4_9_14_0_2_um_filter_39_13]